MNRSMPSLPVHHQLPEFTQTHVHWVGDAIQPSHPLPAPSPALNPSQHQSQRSESHSVVSNSATPYSPWNSPGQNTGVGSLSLLQGSLGWSRPRDRTRSPALQSDSLSTEPQGKPKNTGVGCLSFLQRIFSTQESNQGLLHCRQILYQLSYQGSPKYRLNFSRIALLPWNQWIDAAFPWKAQRWPLETCYVGYSGKETSWWLSTLRVSHTCSTHNAVGRRLVGRG